MQPPIKQHNLGKTVFDANGEKLGMVGEVWLNDSTQEPEWLGVDMMGGTMHHVVPVEGSREDDAGFHVATTKDQVMATKDIMKGQIDDATNQKLRAHYGLT